MLALAFNHAGDVLQVAPGRFLTKDVQAALAEMLHDWEVEAGPVDEEAVTVMADRYGL